MNGSTINPTLHRRAYGRNYWYRLQLVQDFGTVDDAGNTVPSRKLDECVKWVEEKLKDWPNCNRMAWDMWDFKHRKDAEKFITIFHLSWEQ
jgi:hypothetical protein